MKNQIITEGLTFDDVLLKPQRSNIMSRKDIDLCTKISRTITLNIPIISANMNTVTESRMAIAMARLGGIGIIHRFLSIEQQVKEVVKVKRAENYIIKNPITIEETQTLAHAKEIMRKEGIKSLIVVKNNKIKGILTRRDIQFEHQNDTLVKSLMTKRDALIVASPTTTLAKAQQLFKKYKVEKLPLVDSDDTVVGLITARDLRQHLNPTVVRDPSGRLLVGAAVGARGDYLERTEAVLKANADLIILDIAHGHLELCLKALKTLKQKFPSIDVIAGNIATKEAARDLIKAGADGLKVGIGPGSICKTRVVSGSGVPQLTAIMDSKLSAGKIPLIADGGMRTSGDATKALGAGASAIMSGWFFAGTEESPGEIVMWNNQRAKLYRGMASLAARIDQEKNINGNGSEKSYDEFVAEGADQVTTPYKGKVSEVVGQLIGGIRSGMSYCGAHTILELWKKAQFIKITSASQQESGIHDVNY